MKSAKSKRQLTLLTLVVALGVAVYLNWEYSRNENGFLTAQDPDTLAVAAQASEEQGTTEPLDLQVSAGASAESGVTEPLPNKNYGEAQLVSTDADSGEDYFEQARLTRSKTRDEALDKIQTILKDAQLTDEEKEEVTKSLSQQLENITLEGEIESLIKAKGFSDCIVFLDGEMVSAAVKTGGEALDKTSVAQIRDVILSKFDTKASNITIVEVK